MADPTASRTPPAAVARERILLRASFAYGVLALALFKAALWQYVSSIRTGGNLWAVGDWLINYGGGFVRRGLFGEVFLTVAPGGTAGLWLLFFIKLALYSMVLVWMVQVLHRTRYSWSAIAVACGPAGLAFIGWDAAGGFRKEVLVFAVLVLLGWARSRQRAIGSVVLVVVALTLFFFAVFSWEASALVLPAVWYLLRVRGAQREGLEVFRRSAVAAFTVVAGVGAVASTVAHGDVNTAMAVCSSVLEHGFLPHICGGGIDAIGWTSAKTQQDLAASFPLYVGYLPLILWALVPVVVSRWFRRNWGWAVLVVLGILPLFAVVTDYGRWTHISVIALTICMTADDPNGVHSPLWNWVSGIAYVSFWGLPHWLPPQTGSWPWLGLAQSVIDGIRSLELLMAAVR